MNPSASPMYPPEFDHLIKNSIAVSAPGKLILFGEHSVVYGKTAIAASINRRTRIDIKETDDDMLTLVMPNIGVNCAFSFDKVTSLINKSIPGLSKSKEPVSDPSVIDHLAFVNATEKNLGEFLDIQKLSKEQKSSLLVLFYLLHAIFYKWDRIRPFIFEVSSELTLGAGTGSSASYCVCVAAAFLRYRDKRNGIFCPKILNEEEMKPINQWALAGEKIVHGKPSGLDNTVCTFGSFLVLNRGAQAAANREAPTSNDIKPIKFIQFPPKINILLIDTDVSRNTAELVKRVNCRLGPYQGAAYNILNAMDEIGKSASDLLDEIGLLQKNGQYEEKSFKSLETLIDMNQGLLYSLGVSHRRLQEICMICAEHGFHAKLTGAGGGGYAFTIILPNLETQLAACIKDLKDHGYKTLEVLLGGEGLQMEK